MSGDPKFVARELAAIFGGDRRSGLERRITKADTWTKGAGERRSRIYEDHEFVAGFVDRRGPDHFNAAPNAYDKRGRRLNLV